mmetsp:Transcript_22321/g.88604  ORF Transcript_22321/g.88604 Transcript_22321/m.88604 type:complete len:283 (+) Transcript_22321:20-868(+)
MARSSLFRAFALLQWLLATNNGASGFRLAETTTTSTRVFLRAGEVQGRRRRADPALNGPWPTTTALAATAPKKKKSPRRPEPKGFGAAPPCPCGSGAPFSSCCEPILRDADARRAATPAQIVRSRYTAYARADWAHLIATTHPTNSAYTEDRAKWLAELRAQPYAEYRFVGADILSCEQDDQADTPEAAVAFVAKLRHKPTNDKADFQERSYFLKDPAAGWLYVGGDVSAPALIDLATGDAADAGSILGGDAATAAAGGAVGGGVASSPATTAADASSSEAA